MARPRLTIRRKLILSISIPLLVTYLGLLVWDYYRQRSITVQQMQQTALERAEGTAARLDTRLSSVMHVTNSLATLFEPPTRRTDLQVRTALAGVMRMPWIASATVTLESESGGAIHSVTRHRSVGTPGPNRDRDRDRVAVDSAEPRWYERTKSARTAAWTDPYTSSTGENTNLRVCTYAAPIIVDNAVVGTAAVTVDLRQVRRFPDGRGGFLDGPPPGGPPDQPRETPSTTSLARSPTSTSDELADFAVFDGQGRLVMVPASDEKNPPSETLYSTAARLQQPEIGEAARYALKGESQVIRVTGLKQVIASVPDDTHHWLAMTPISSTGWLLVSAVPESVSLEPVLRRLWERAAFLGAGLVVLLLVVLGVSVSISRPIERLAAAVDRVAAGDWRSEIENVKSNDELGRLSVGFNHMTRQLRSQIATLTEQTAAREKVESELRIARQIQTDLLPSTFPDSRKFALHAYNLPAMHVAGDFYDFFFTSTGLLTLVIADVSGKGVPAAILMAVTRTVVRNLAQAGQSPAEIAEATNRTLLTDTSAAMFVTMLLCQYDPSTGKLVYVNAGHPPALRLRPGSAPEQVCDMPSPLLGVDVDGSLGPFQQGESHLDPGDTLFLYTDGVSEAPGPDGGLLRTEGVAQLLAPLASATPDAVCRQTSQRLEQLCNGHRADDITMLVLRRADTRE